MTEAVAEEEPLFDVSVNMPAGATLEDIDRKARAAGIPNERVDALLKVLRSVPSAKIGSGVPRSRALKARDQFQAAGLGVTLTPVLSLQAMTEAVGDGKEKCPACEQRVALTADRQCTNCGVYVDKVTEEVLMRRKILQQERMRLAIKEDRDSVETERRVREALEKEMRDKIRRELEDEYEDRIGAGKAAAGPKRWLLAGAALGLAGLSFFGGHFATGRVPGLGTVEAKEAKEAKANPMDSMLDRIGPKGAAADATAAAAAQNGGAPTGDADVDDPLVQAAGGKRIGAKGLSVEQAVAAAKILGKSVGVTAPGEGAGAGGATAAAAAAGTDAATAPAVALQPADRALLVADFARHLAELGQLDRARAVLKALQAAPAAQEPRVQAAARSAGVEVAAWAAQGATQSAARKAIEALLADASGIAQPAERARALARAATIVARHPQLPPEAPRALLTQASEAVKAAPEAERAVLTGEWTVALGEVLAAQAAQQARSGKTARAQAIAGEIAAIAEQAPPAVQPELRALESVAWHHAGQAPQAAQAMDKALALLGSEGSVPRRTALLRSVGHLAGSAEHEKVAAVAASLQPVAEQQQGADRMQALGELSVLHAGAGSTGRAEQLARLALATEGVEPAAAAPHQAGLLVRVDLAAARAHHATGYYARSEELLRRVADYLF